MSRAGALASCFACLVASAAPAAPGRQHYDGAGLAFDLPAGWKVTPASDPNFDLALRLTSATLSATVLVDRRKISDGELESLAAERRAAHVKNRVAWGMHAAGGPPRQALRIGGRAAVRFRDRVAGALGAGDQIMTCLVVSARLACVLSSGPPETRDEADAAADLILSSLSLRGR